MNQVLIFLIKSVKYPLFLLFIIIGLSACSEEISLANDDLGQAYFPVKVGNYWIYEVSETKVLDNQYDSITYEIREQVDTVYTNQVNELTYRVLKSQRSNSSQPWGSDSLYTINLNRLDVQVTRNNKRRIALIFPIVEGNEWNVNAYNINGEKEYFYQDVNQPLTIQDKSYDKTIKVMQGQTNPNYLDDSYEVYAYNLGLVYKNFRLYEYAKSNLTGEIDQTHVIIGIKQTYTLKEFYSSE